MSGGRTLLLFLDDAPALRWLRLADGAVTERGGAGILPPLAEDEAQAAFLRRLTREQDEWKRLAQALGAEK